MRDLVRPDLYDAVLFDLDGVLTTTRAVHVAAWQRTFDDFLSAWDAEHGTQTQEFSPSDDYLQHVDGKQRQDGVRDFLGSRDISLPEGSPDSPPEEDSVWGLSNRKQLLVEAEIEEHGVEVFPGSIAWLRQLRGEGMRTAVVSSSRNCEAVLEYAGITDLFDDRVDGDTAMRLNLPGKPAPDMFLEAARRLGVSPERAVVVEDAIAGVQAGAAGGFGLVIAVDRDGHYETLRREGANVVVDDLSELMQESATEEHPYGPKTHRLIQAAQRILASTEDFPAEPFRLVERGYNPESTGQTETLFALGNGFLGLRGSHDEGTPSYMPGVLLNGFHETRAIHYAEDAVGFARTGQSILNAPDGTRIRLFVDDDPLDCSNVEVLEYERALDMATATLERRVIYQLPGGRRYWVRSRRFASLAHRHLACIQYEITALDEDTTISVASEMITHYRGSEKTEDPRRGLGFPKGVYEAVDERVSGESALLALRTKNSKLTVACGMDHEVRADTYAHVGTKTEGDFARTRYRIEAKVGKPVLITKWISYHYGGEDANELLFRAESTLDRARARGYAEEVRRHTMEVDAFWQASDINIEGAPLLQQAIRYSLFSVMQASRRSEGHGVAAKGVTGLGYEGHYFWDTEIYVLPFLIHTSPAVARSLLLFRYSMLDAARRRATEVGQRGALFPWRTISGEEASAYYAAGTAQYHINADIAYAVAQYSKVTGDWEFMRRYGVDILVETARLWLDLGHFSPQHRGRFVINGVTGPDEYSTVVDNNLYTNMMAAENLRLAQEMVLQLRDEAPDMYRNMQARTGLTEGEAAAWARAAAEMYVPYDEGIGLHLQDDAFLNREVWDFDGTPPEKYPLLLNYHPLVIYRHQVIKQADVVLATVLLPDEFSTDEKKRIFEYYDPLTTGDSSLSESIQSIAAAEIGEMRTAEEYLIDAVAVDIADRAGNVRDGVHVASAGGSWLAIVYGFAGMRHAGEAVSFRPSLPARVHRVTFPIRVRGTVLEVDIQQESVTYTVTSGDPLEVIHDGQEFLVGVGSPVTMEC
jgi:alpha,alpha-trehalose phosphorylase